MRLIDAEPLEQKLFPLADKMFAKNPYEKASICAFRKALEMVMAAPTVEFAATLPNLPLTLEELQEMVKDKPVVVWSVCYAQDYKGALCQPKRLDWKSGEWLMFDGYDFIGEGLLDDTREYGRRFVAYRRKPEEGVK